VPIGAAPSTGRRELSAAIGTTALGERESVGAKGAWFWTANGENDADEGGKSQFEPKWELSRG